MGSRGLKAPRHTQDAAELALAKAEAGGAAAVAALAAAMQPAHVNWPQVFHAIGGAGSGIPWGAADRGPAGTRASQLLLLDEFRLAPVMVALPDVIEGIHGNIATAGAAGATVTVALWQAPGGGLLPPYRLLWHGDLAATATGNQQIVPATPVAIEAGVLFAGVRANVATSSWRCLTRGVETPFLTYYGLPSFTAPTDAAIVFTTGAGATPTDLATIPAGRGASMPHLVFGAP